jgi:hypothetical protein
VVTENIIKGKLRVTNHGGGVAILKDNASDEPHLEIEKK